MALTHSTNSNINNRFLPPPQTQLQVFTVTAYISVTATENFNKLWPLKMLSTGKGRTASPANNADIMSHEVDTRGWRSAAGTWSTVDTVSNTPPPPPPQKRVERTLHPDHFFWIWWIHRQTEATGFQLHGGGSKASLFCTNNEYNEVCAFWTQQ